MMVKRSAMTAALLMGAALTAWAVQAPAQAAKGTKGAKGGAKSGRLLARFDRDHNGTIDGQEVERLQAVYDSLAALDIDHNGKLSESEISAAKIPVGKKGGKKAAAAPATSSSTSSTPSTTPKKAQ